MSKIQSEIPTRLYKNGILKDDYSPVVIEKPVTLYVNGVNWLTFMCTPKNLEELAVGYLFNEGIIKNLNDVKIVAVGRKNHNIDIWLNNNVEIPKNWRRTSGCAGGYTTAILEEISPVKIVEINISPTRVTELFKVFLSYQDAYKEVGGIHSSGLSDGNEFIFIFEDIGRHNTLDKISGKVILENINLTPKIIFTTGRVSSDMVQKAAMIDTSLIISRTSPTTLSVEIAKELGIGLIGYTRGKRFTVYTMPTNIIFE